MSSFSVRKNEFGKFEINVNNRTMFFTSELLSDVIDNLFKIDIPYDPGTGVGIVLEDENGNREVLAVPARDIPEIMRVLQNVLA